jgi:hypothetical protein
MFKGQTMAQAPRCRMSDTVPAGPVAGWEVGSVRRIDQTLANMLGTGRRVA